MAARIKEESRDFSEFGSIKLYVVYYGPADKEKPSSRQDTKIMEIVYKQKDLQVLPRHHLLQMQVLRLQFRGNPAKLLKGINPL
jgi:hypothetical protein